MSPHQENQRHFCILIKKLLFCVQTFSNFCPKPTRNRNLNHLRSSWRSPNISVSIWIYSKSSLPTDLSTFDKSVVLRSSRIFVYSNYSKLFCFFQIYFSFWILKSPSSFKFMSLFLLLGFFCSNSSLVCPWSHNN